MPEVGVYTSDEPNAFATGPRKDSSLIAVSTGLLDNMTDEEIK
jgi:heat shock protein HtpX